MHERLLKRLRPGRRLAPVRELAAEFGVCVETIRAAQRLLAVKGILEIRHGSGVYVAGGKSHWRVGILSELNLFDHRIGHYLRAVAGALKSQLEAMSVEPLLYVGNAFPGAIPSGRERERPGYRRCLDSRRP
jgi:DNA-binding transcriptional regulator YhcF (GntR family)